MNSLEGTPTRDMARDNLRAMIIQEAKAYRIPTEHLESIVYHNEEKTDDACCFDNCSPTDLAVYLGWRSQMVAWCYSIAATTNFEKETVEIAISMVDRYVALRTELLTDAVQYQLVCMACLYTAAKIHESLCLTPKQLELLSSNRFSTKQFEAVEVEVLAAIQWKVNPPTAIAFCRNLLDLVPAHDLVAEDRKTVLDVAESQIEIALAEKSFLPIKASSIGVAALMNALQYCVLQRQQQQQPSEQQQLSYYSLFSCFTDALGLKQTSFRPKLDLLRKSLRSLVVGSSLDLLLGTCDNYDEHEDLLSRNSVLHVSSSQTIKADASQSPRSVVSSIRQYIR